MTNAKEIVTAYQRALGKGDMAGARKYLHDDLAFVGPFDTFHRPEPYRSENCIISSNAWNQRRPSSTETTCASCTIW